MPLNGEGTAQGQIGLLNGLLQLFTRGYFSKMSGVNKHRLFPLLARACISLSSVLTTLNAQEHSQSSLGEILGKITASAKDDQEEVMSHVVSTSRYNRFIPINENSIEPYRLSEKAVVFIDSIKTVNTTNAQASHPELKQRDLMFRPLVLPVLVGTTVDFPNQDDLFHNVFSYSQPKEFDLGRYPRGQRKSITFDKPGLVSVFCDIHSHMYATILVLDNPYFAVPDDAGNFLISNIPAGTYQVSFWYGRKRAETRRVTVRAGQKTRIDFAY